MIICSKISHMVEGDGDRHLVNMVLDDDGETIGQLGDPAVAKKAEFILNEQIQTRFVEKGGVYADSFRAVMSASENAALKQAYAGFTRDRYEMARAQPYHGITSLQAGVVIDRHVKAYIHEHPGTGYQDAQGFVITADPELEATYASFQ